MRVDNELSSRNFAIEVEHRSNSLSLAHPPCASQLSKALAVCTMAVAVASFTSSSRRHDCLYPAPPLIVDILPRSGLITISPSPPLLLISSGSVCLFPLSYMSRFMCTQLDCILTVRFCDHILILSWTECLFQIHILPLISALRLDYRQSRCLPGLFAF